MVKKGVSLQQAASNQVAKDTIIHFLFAKLSVMCRHNTGSSLVLGAFFLLE